MNKTLTTPHGDLACVVAQSNTTISWMPVNGAEPIRTWQWQPNPLSSLSVHHPLHQWERLILETIPYHEIFRVVDYLASGIVSPEHPFFYRIREPYPSIKKRLYALAERVEQGLKEVGVSEVTFFCPTHPLSDLTTITLFLFIPYEKKDESFQSRYQMSSEAFLDLLFQLLAESWNMLKHRQDLTLAPYKKMDSQALSAFREFLTTYWDSDFSTLAAELGRFYWMEDPELDLVVGLVNGYPMEELIQNYIIEAWQLRP